MTAPGRGFGDPDWHFIDTASRELYAALHGHLVGVTATYRNDSGELVTIGRSTGETALREIVITDPAALAGALTACSIVVTPDGPAS